MKGADDIVRKRIEAKNALENYTYNIKNALSDEKLKDKFKPEEKT
jgi:heat shock protein 1/8